jgi:hypothetical protein
MKKGFMFLASLVLSAAMLMGAMTAAYAASANPAAAAKEFKAYDVEGGSFEGYRANGKAEGFAKITYDNGEEHYGIFSNDWGNGFRIRIISKDTANWLQFAGFFKDSKLHGAGARMYTDSEGNYIREAGNWDNGVLIDDADKTVTKNEYGWIRGFSVSGLTSPDMGITNPRKLTYTGEVKYGTQIPHGYGVMEIEGGILHAGEFKDGVFNGYGIRYNPDHSYYEGVWAGLNKVETITYCYGITEEEITASPWAFHGEARPTVKTPDHVTEGNADGTAAAYTGFQSGYYLLSFSGDVNDKEAFKEYDVYFNLGYIQAMQNISDGEE